MSNQFDIAIDLERLTDFFFWNRLWCLIPFYGSRCARLQAERLSYRVEDDVLHADSGLVYYQRKSIPLRQITDVNLVQGPRARMFGIWILYIQTAGKSGPLPEAIIWGPADAEITRDALLSSIQRVKEIDTPRSY